MNDIHNSTDTLDPEWKTCLSLTGDRAYTTGEKREVPCFGKQYSDLVYQVQEGIFLVDFVITDNGFRHVEKQVVKRSL